MSTLTLRRYAPAIDVDDLVARCLGNIEFADRLLGLMTTQCDSEIAELERAVEQRATTDVCRIAHRLKGSLASASAKQLSQLADSICEAARHDRTDVALDLLKRLRSQWDELLASSDRNTTLMN